MKRTLLLFTSILVFSSDLISQNSIDSIMMVVEKNNTTLSSFRKNTDADKVGNKTGLYPQNPEAAFNYLWGKPSAIGNRTDFSIKQTFDFPMAYSYKIQISNLKNEQAELEYQRQRKAILLQTLMVCIDMINLNVSKMELLKRMTYAEQIANSYKLKFDIGEANILDYNKARINLLNITKEVEANEIERNARLSELAGLNGGTDIIFKDSIYPQQTIISDFEKWYTQVEANNPFLQWLKQEIAISQKQKQLNTALSLPRLDAGYMSESVVGEQFQGIALGISIPLWENKNSFRYARFKTIAIQGMEADAKLQFYNEMKALHSKVTNLQISVIDYRAQLVEFSNHEMLRKALDMGEVSLAEYFIELSFYYESIDKLFEMEKDLNKSFAELNQYL